MIELNMSSHTRTLLLLASLCLLVGCSKTVDEEKTVVRYKLRYEINKETPFSGRVVGKSGIRRVSARCSAVRTGDRAWLAQVATFGSHYGVLAVADRRHLIQHEKLSPRKP